MKAFVQQYKQLRFMNRGEEDRPSGAPSSPRAAPRVTPTESWRDRLARVSKPVVATPSLRAPAKRPAGPLLVAPAPLLPMRKALPIELVLSVAGHLDARRDLAHLERAFVRPVPGLYAALGQGEARSLLQPLLPAVRAMHVAHPALAAHELPLGTPDWELRFLVDFGAPVAALGEVSFPQLDTMRQGLRSLPFLRHTPLCKQIEEASSARYGELLTELLSCLHDAYVQACEAEQLNLAWLERSAPLAHAVRSRMGEAGVSALAAMTASMAAWRLRQLERPLDQAERRELSMQLLDTWLVFGAELFALRGPF